MTFCKDIGIRLACWSHIIFVIVCVLFHIDMINMKQLQEINGALMIKRWKDLYFLEFIKYSLAEVMCSQIYIHSCF